MRGQYEVFSAATSPDCIGLGFNILGLLNILDKLKKNGLDVLDTLDILDIVNITNNGNIGHVLWDLDSFWVCYKLYQCIIKHIEQYIYY